MHTSRRSGEPPPAFYQTLIAQLQGATHWSWRDCSQPRPRLFRSRPAAFRGSRFIAHARARLFCLVQGRGRSAVTGSALRRGCFARAEPDRDGDPEAPSLCAAHSSARAARRMLGAALSVGATKRRRTGCVARPSYPSWPAHIGRHGGACARDRRSRTSSRRNLRGARRARGKGAGGGLPPPGARARVHQYFDRCVDPISSESWRLCRVIHVLSLLLSATAARPQTSSCSRSRRQLIPRFFCAALDFELPDDTSACRTHRLMKRRAAPRTRRRRIEAIARRGGRHARHGMQYPTLPPTPFQLRA